VGEIARLMKVSMEFQSAIAMTIRDAMKRDPARTLQIINTQLTGQYRNDALRIVVQDQVDRKDFTAAAATLNSMPISGDRDQAIANIAGRIGETGIDQSLKWFDQLQTEMERRSALSWIVTHFSEKNDTAALQRLLEVATDTEERKQLLARIAYLMRAADPRAAQDYVNSYSGPERDYAANRLMAWDIVNDPALPFPEKVKRATALESAEARWSAIDMLISSETKRDPEQMARAVMALPNESKTQAVNAFASAWVSVDADGASAWIKNLPSGDVKDSAISGAVRQLKLRSRSRAQEVATWVDNPALREKLLKGL
jgi:hypothetical protein